MKFSMFVLIVLLALVAAFAVQNPVEVTVRFFSLSVTTHLLVVIVASPASTTATASRTTSPTRRVSSATCGRSRAAMTNWHRWRACFDELEGVAVRVVYTF